MAKSEIHSETPAVAGWTLPPPADLESAAPLPPFDNVINRSIRERVRRHPDVKGGERERKKEGEGEREKIGR